MLKRYVVATLVIFFAGGCLNSNLAKAEKTSVVATKAQEILDSLLSTQAAKPSTEPQIPPAPPPTETAAQILTPTTDRLQIPQIPVADCVPKDSQRDLAQVTRVIDGDTIEVQINGQIHRVRYIGMDTPENGQAFSNEATSANEQLIANKQVLLVKDVSEVGYLWEAVTLCFCRKSICKL